MNEYEVNGVTYDMVKVDNLRCDGCAFQGKLKECNAAPECTDDDQDLYFIFVARNPTS